MIDVSPCKIPGPSILKSSKNAKQKICNETKLDIDPASEPLLKKDIDEKKDHLTPNDSKKHSNKSDLRNNDSFVQPLLQESPEQIRKDIHIPNSESFSGIQMKDLEEKKEKSFIEKENLKKVAEINEMRNTCLSSFSLLNEQSKSTNIENIHSRNGSQKSNISEYRNSPNVASSQGIVDRSKLIQSAAQKNTISDTCDQRFEPEKYTDDKSKYCGTSTVQSTLGMGSYSSGQTFSNNQVGLQPVSGNIKLIEPSCGMMPHRSANTKSIFTIAKTGQEKDDFMKPCQSIAFPISSSIEKNKNENLNKKIEPLVIKSSPENTIVPLAPVKPFHINTPTTKINASNIICSTPKTSYQHSPYLFKEGKSAPDSAEKYNYPKKIDSITSIYGSNSVAKDDIEKKYSQLIPKEDAKTCNKSSSSGTSPSGQSMVKDTGSKVIKSTNVTTSQSELSSSSSLQKHETISKNNFSVNKNHSVCVGNKEQQKSEEIAVTNTAIAKEIGKSTPISNIVTAAQTVFVTENSSKQTNDNKKAIGSDIKKSDTKSSTATVCYQVGKEGEQSKIKETLPLKTSTLNDNKRDIKQSDQVKSSLQNVNSSTKKSVNEKTVDNQVKITKVVDNQVKKPDSDKSLVPKTVSAVTTTTAVTLGNNVNQHLKGTIQTKGNTDSKTAANKIKNDNTNDQNKKNKTQLGYTTNNDCSDHTKSSPQQSSNLGKINASCDKEKDISQKNQVQSTRENKPESSNVITTSIKSDLSHINQNKATVILEQNKNNTIMKTIPMKSDSVNMQSTGKKESKHSLSEISDVTKPLGSKDEIPGKDDTNKLKEKTGITPSQSKATTMIKAKESIPVSGSEHSKIVEVCLPSSSEKSSSASAKQKCESNIKESKQLSINEKLDNKSKSEMSKKDISDPKVKEPSCVSPHVPITNVGSKTITAGESVSKQNDDACLKSEVINKDNTGIVTSAKNQCTDSSVCVSKQNKIENAHQSNSLQSDKTISKVCVSATATPSKESETDKKSSSSQKK